MEKKIQNGALGFSSTSLLTASTAVPCSKTRHELHCVRLQRPPRRHTCPPSAPSHSNQIGLITVRSRHSSAQPWCGKQWRCPSTDEWIRKRGCSHAMEYCWEIKMTEVWLCATPWMNLKNITLSERQPVTKDPILRVPFICYGHKSIETENRLMVAKGWGREEWGVSADREGVP